MAHKYDEFYKSLHQARVYALAALEEAERLQLSATRKRVRDIANELGEITSNVLVKIEAAQVADAMEAWTKTTAQLGMEFVPDDVAQRKTAAQMLTEQWPNLAPTKRHEVHQFKGSPRTEMPSQQLAYYSLLAQGMGAMPAIHSPHHVGTHISTIDCAPSTQEILTNNDTPSDCGNGGTDQ